MVSQQIITPATYSSWVEIARNRFLEPIPKTSAYYPASRMVTDFTTDPGGDYVRGTVNLAGSPYFNLLSATNRTPATPGEQIKYSAQARIGSGAIYVVMRIYYQDAGGAILAQSDGPQYTSTSWGELTHSSVAPAGTVWAGAYILMSSASPLGATLDVRKVFGGNPGPYVDGGSVGAGNPLQRSAWLGAVNASMSTLEVRTELSPATYGDVYEVITLTSPDDVITFKAMPEDGVYIYDNVSLQRWYEPADIDADDDSRPNANGAFGLGTLYTEAHKPLIIGQYYGTSSTDAKAKRQRLLAMFNEGNSVVMAVTDELGVTTSREVWLVDYAAPFAADFSHFTFDLDFIAPDPLRYGELTSATDGMPTQGSGLVWDLGTSGSGLYFDWGTAGVAGQIALTNGGGSAAYPLIEVGGAGRFANGFRITELETGRELTFARATVTGDVIKFDSRTGRATLNGGDVTGLMSSRKWFVIPKGQTRRYQITPFGAVAGSPTITGYVGAAWL